MLKKVLIPTNTFRTSTLGHRGNYNSEPVDLKENVNLVRASLIKEFCGEMEQGCYV